MNKIKRASFFFRVLFQCFFVVIPVMQTIAWWIAPKPITLLFHSITFDVIPKVYAGLILHPLSVPEKGLGFLVSLIPVSIEMAILYFLIKLFHLYEKGEIFSLRNVHYIRNIGYALLIGQIIAPIYEGAMGFILTMNNPHGYRVAKITIDQTNGGILLIAFIIILISWIMAEGCKLREEQQLTI